MCTIFCSVNIPTAANNNTGNNWTRTKDPKIDAAWDALDKELNDSKRASLNTDGQWVGVLAILLPFLEQSSVYSAMMSGVPSNYLDKAYNGQPWYTIQSTFDASQAQIKTFLCPSDSPQDCSRVIIRRQATNR